VYLLLDEMLDKQESNRHSDRQNMKDHKIQSCKQMLEMCPIKTFLLQRQMEQKKEFAPPKSNLQKYGSTKD